MNWKLANDPPKTKEGCWSKGVVVITNYGDVFSIAYFGEKEDGCWQRPTAFKVGEEVDMWIEKPEGYQR